MATSVLLPMTTFAQLGGTPTSGRTSQATNQLIATRAGLAGGDPINIIGNIIQIALGLLGVLLLLYFLYAGFLWMTSGGDSGQTDKAKGYMKSAVIGLVIIVTSFALSSFVLDQLATITTRT